MIRDPLLQPVRNPYPVAILAEDRDCAICNDTLCTYSLRRAQDGEAPVRLCLKHIRPGFTRHPARWWERHNAKS